MKVASIPFLHQNSTFKFLVLYKLLKDWTVFTLYREFEFSEENSADYRQSVTNKWNANANSSAFGWLFNARASTGGEISRSNMSVDTDGFKMSFEVTQVPISRPWFAPEFLRNTTWR